MIEVIQSVAALIVTLSILVTIHEFGHYWVARLCGVHVLRFSVGFGNPIWSRRGPQPVVPPPPPEQEIRSRANEPLEGTEFRSLRPIADSETPTTPSASKARTCCEPGLIR